MVRQQNHIELNPFRPVKLPTSRSCALAVILPVAVASCIHGYPASASIVRARPHSPAFNHLQLPLKSDWRSSSDYGENWRFLGTSSALGSWIPFEDSLRLGSNLGNTVTVEEIVSYDNTYMIWLLYVFDFYVIWLYISMIWLLHDNKWKLQ